jgi:hypothetical protein
VNPGIADEAKLSAAIVNATMISSRRRGTRTAAPVNSGAPRTTPSA